jgi:hypothetical protein
MRRSRIPRSDAVTTPTPLEVAREMYERMIDPDFPETERAAALLGSIAVSLLAIAEELHVMNHDRTS